MKAQKILRLLLAGAILVTSVTACSTSKTDSSSDESTIESATDSSGAEPSEEPYSNDELVLRNANGGITSQYYIGDHQVLTYIDDDDYSAPYPGDGTIPEDFDERYSDQPELVRLAHEYGELGEFYDYFTAITENVHSYDGVTIGQRYYDFNHGFCVYVNSDTNIEERYYVTLLPEDLLDENFSCYSNILFTETDFGYSVYSEWWDDFPFREVNYYTDSHLLIDHYVTDTDYYG